MRQLGTEIFSRKKADARESRESDLKSNRRADVLNEKGSSARIRSGTPIEFELQPILQAAFASELKMGEKAGADPGALMLGGGAGTFGMKHLEHVPPELNRQDSHGVLDRRFYRH